MYLVDTSVIVEFFRKNKEVIDKLYNLSQEDDLIVSSFSLAELYYGAEKSNKPQKNLEKVGLFLIKLGVSVRDFDKETARIYGSLYYNLEKNGEKIPISDSIIAATAKVNKCTILSTDQKHFAYLNKYNIKVEIIGNNS